jgi:hypothetical protein
VERIWRFEKSLNEEKFYSMKESRAFWLNVEALTAILSGRRREDRL